MSYICVFKTLAYVNGHVSVWRKVSNNPELLQTDSIKLLNVEGYNSLLSCDLICNHHANHFYIVKLGFTRVYFFSNVCS